MEHPSNTDVKQLQELVIEMAKTITRLSDNFHLKAVVGSVLDTQNVEDTIDELKAINANHPQSIINPGSISSD